MKRNPIHYAAMSKFTNSFKTMEAILDIEMDQVPGFESFLDLYFQLQCFEVAEETFDPRRSANVLSDYKKLVKPAEWNIIAKEFKHQATILLKEVLNQQDANYQSPLHVASYFGDFKASRLIIKKGAESKSAAFAERPLNVSKDKFTRNVLQSLNKAAGESNDRDIKYLVNCGNKIDALFSIFCEAPIHKAVLSGDAGKKEALSAIIQDCNANVN